MMRNSTDLIVDQLTAELKPVKPLRSPLVYAALWLAVSTVFIGILVMHHGMRPDIGVLLAEPGYRMLFLACAGTAVLGAAATFLISLPDRTPYWALLPVPALSLWFAGTGIGCYADWVQYGPDGIVTGTSFGCLGWIIAASLPLDVLLVLMIRHAAFVRPRLALTIGMMSAAALASAGLMLFHEIETTLMIFIWHGGAVLLLSALAGAGVPVFRRLAGSV
jgi:hypothetical protein